MKRRYLVVYEKGKRNYSGFAPDVPGCAATAKTIEQMRALMAEALEFHLEGLAEDGDPIPEAVTTAYPVSFDEDSEGVLGYVVEWADVRLPKTKVQPRRRTMRKAA